MSEQITFTIDGKEITGEAGQTILEAADEAGVYIPRLCYKEELSPYGSCRLCTVMVNGRPMAACTSPIGDGINVECETPRLQQMRRDVIDMLFVEGNHFCMFCEASGFCELQAMAYRFGIMAPRFPYQYPKREIDASHPEVYLDHNRCILCARCIRSSQELDGKNALEFVGRGPEKRVGYNGKSLAESGIAADDRAVANCPVGALMKKHVGYSVPVGKRQYDFTPIGAEIECKQPESTQ
jgi:[NiFe] hydrogenase diaphorase moiety small subunit